MPDRLPAVVADLKADRVVWFDPQLIKAPLPDPDVEQQVVGAIKVLVPTILPGVSLP